MISFDHHTGNYLNVDDAKIYYERIGDPQKPALLLLHGGFGTMEDFNSILSSLADKFYITGIDSRGQGKSTLGKQKLTYERIQLDAEAVLQYLHIDKPTIIGFSDGGIVAYRLASCSSLPIEKLVTIGSRWSENDALLTKELFLRITPDSWKAKFPDMYHHYQLLNPEAEFNFLTTAIKNMWLDTTSSGYPGEQVKKINCPTLIVRGDNDHLLSRKSAAELAARIKNTTLLNIPVAGHVAFRDQPEIFKRVLNPFLNK